jgi:phage terminase Nu1 subunit (DNA packaging protein)
VLIIANTSIRYLRRRKQSVNNKNKVRIITTIVDRRKTKITSNKDLAKGKKQILKLKNIVSKATQATTELLEDLSSLLD